MTKVFIDGREGTTGLKIYERLVGRHDVELISIPDGLRKDAAARAECINASDVTFLCLPDAAAVEAVGLAGNDRVRIIDASTAHRTAPGWVYGLPELGDDRYEAIRTGGRIAVPGCHASGFVALVYPLVKCGALAPGEKLSAFSLTGYSGGGKKMIAEYESEGRSPLLGAPRQYGLGQTHKHLKEMTAVTGLDSPPVFSPIVSDYFCGMEVTVPLFGSQVGGLGADGVRALYEAFYAGRKIVKVLPGGAGTGGFLPANLMAGRDDMRIFVSGNDDRIVVSALFDNLGKGASGAAIQCMNIMIGADETTGLVVSDDDIRGEA